MFLNAYLTLAQLREVGGCSFDRAAGLHEVDAAELPHVLAQTENPEVALAARLAWWQALNHAYRERYRLHRDAEEAHTQALWQAQNPSSQSWWAKLRKRTPIRYVPAPGRPFTYPPFVPNAEQRDNMHALLALLDAACARAPQWALMAEVQRQLGMFGQAQRTMAQLARPLWTYGEVLIQQLIAEQEPAPMRYRL